MVKPLLKPRVVVCAALSYEGIIILGARHFDHIMHKQIGLLPEPLRASAWKQGFIDQHGVFMDRVEAHAVATEAGQIQYRCGGDTKELFSENLY